MLNYVIIPIYKAIRYYLCLLKSRYIIGQVEPFPVMCCFLCIMTIEFIEKSVIVLWQKL